MVFIVLRLFCFIGVISWYTTGIWKLINEYFHNEFKKYLENEITNSHITEGSESNNVLANQLSTSLPPSLPSFHWTDNDEITNAAVDLTGDYKRKGIIFAPTEIIPDLRFTKNNNVTLTIDFIQNLFTFKCTGTDIRDDYIKKKSNIFKI